MILHPLIHAEGFTHEMDMIRREIEKNILGKLDSYMKKFSSPESEPRLEITLTRDAKKDEKKNSTVSWKLILKIHTQEFRSKRENFEKIEDLINHLFTHIKTQMGK